MKVGRLLCLMTLAGTFALAQSNQIPLIYQLYPESAIPGRKSFTLTVQGSGFSSDAVVNWNGAARTTVFVNGAQLQATIDASDVAHQGTAAVTVSQSSGASNVVYFTVRKSAPTVAMARFDHPVGHTGAIAVGDFNNDGKLDIALGQNSDAGGANFVNVFLGTGNGAFSGPILNISQLPAVALLAADFNGDGNLDLAVEDGLGNASVFLGDGQGAFSEQAVFAASPSSVDMAAADLNGDGNMDLVSAGGSVGAPCVMIFLGNGDGTFNSSPQLFTAISAGNPAIADFDGDSKLDLAVPDSLALDVFLGNGDGTFQNFVSYSVADGGTAVAAADVNGDGKLDLVTNGIGVLLGNGDGTFTAGPGSIGSTSSYNVNVGDINGDGKPDVALTSSSTVLVSLGNGDGSFQPPLSFGSGTLSASGLGLGMGDFNNDGKLDLADINLNFTTNSPTLSVFLQIPASASPGTINFANQIVGITSAAQNVTLTNIGSGPLDISSIIVTGTNPGDFAQTNTCPSSLGTGASCTISVTFTPTIQGARSACVTITYAGLGSPQDVVLSGNGIVATVSLVPSSLTFAAQLVNTISTAQMATLTNLGTQPVDISSFTLSGPFLQTNTCGTVLDPGASCSISVQFEPTAPGSASGTLTVFDTGVGSPQMLALSGTGTDVSLTTSHLNFGQQMVGTTSGIKAVKVTNAGSTTLSITSITITGNDPSDFAFTSNCGSTLNAAGSCVIRVTFTPTLTRLRTATLNLCDDGGASPQTVALSGTGTGN